MSTDEKTVITALIIIQMLSPRKLFWETGEQSFM